MGEELPERETVAAQLGAIDPCRGIQHPFGRQPPLPDLCGGAEGIDAFAETCAALQLDAAGNGEPVLQRRVGEHLQEETRLAELPVETDVRLGAPHVGEVLCRTVRDERKKPRRRQLETDRVDVAEPTREPHAEACVQPAQRGIPESGNKEPGLLQGDVGRQVGGKRRRRIELERPGRGVQVGLQLRLRGGDAQPREKKGVGFECESAAQILEHESALFDELHVCDFQGQPGPVRTERIDDQIEFRQPDVRGVEPAADCCRHSTGRRLPAADCCRHSPGCRRRSSTGCRRHSTGRCRCPTGLPAACNVFNPVFGQLDPPDPNALADALADAPADDSADPTDPDSPADAPADAPADDSADSAAPTDSASSADPADSAASTASADSSVPTAFVASACSLPSVVR